MYVFVGTVMLYANFKNHTTLELIACVLMTIRYAIAVAGGFVYRNSGPAATALCALIDRVVLMRSGMFGGIISVVIITLDRYWKIVHPIHHRKYYRRWMVKVGLLIPWLSSVATQFPQFSKMSVVNGRCGGSWRSRSASVVSSRLFVSSLIILGVIGRFCG